MKFSHNKFFYALDELVIRCDISWIVISHLSFGWQEDMSKPMHWISCSQWPSKTQTFSFMSH